MYDCRQTSFQSKALSSHSDRPGMALVQALHRTMASAQAPDPQQNCPHTGRHPYRWKVCNAALSGPETLWRDNQSWCTHLS